MLYMLYICYLVLCLFLISKCFYLWSSSWILIWVQQSLKTYRSSRCCAGWPYPGPAVCSQTGSWWPSSWRNEQTGAPPHLQPPDSLPGKVQDPVPLVSLLNQSYFRSPSAGLRFLRTLPDCSSHHPVLHLAWKQSFGLQQIWKTVGGNERKSRKVGPKSIYLMRLCERVTCSCLLCVASR